MFHHSCCFKYFSCTHFPYSMSFFFATHHSSLAMHALFQASKFLKPSPPNFLGVQAMSQEIEGGLLYSADPPPQRKFLQSGLTLSITSCGRMKIEAQNPYMPNTIVFMSCALLAKERFLVDHCFMPNTPCQGQIAKETKGLPI